MMQVKSGVSIIIPTYNGGDIFRECLSAIAAQQYVGPVELIVIDSGSTDETLKTAGDFDAHILSIPKTDFHHSRTRNRALMTASYPEIVFLVQDAIPVSDHWLQDMSSAMQAADVAALSGRHLPHAHADLYARFEVDLHSEYLGSATRIFGFDKSSGGDESYDTLLRKIRLDNVCSIYRTEVLRHNPFPDVPFGEDVAWAYALLSKGGKIAYDPCVAVYHSHNRSTDYRFRRALMTSLAKATILSRVREDLSHVSFDQYHDVQEQIIRAAGDFTDSLSASSRVIDWKKTIIASRRKMYIRRVAGSLLGKISVFRNMAEKHSRASWVRSFVSAYEHLLHNNFIVVNQRYRGYTPDDLKSFIDSVTYTILGNVLGEIYGSKLLKGVATDEFDSLVKMNMTGV